MLLWWIKGPESLYAGLMGITHEEQLARAGWAETRQESLSMDIATQISKFVEYKNLQWRIANGDYGMIDEYYAIYPEKLVEEMDACLEFIMEDWNSLQSMTN